MPTTFDNAFYGGNPRVEGPNNHHDIVNGRREIIAAPYMNNVENAIIATQAAVNEIEETINEIVSGLRTVTSVDDITALASGIVLL